MLIIDNNLDASVKEINYIEVGHNPLGNYYGIWLQQKAKVGKKSKTFDPESLNYDYYMNQPFTPDTAWHFSNEPYKKAFKAGKAQLKIHVSGIPKELKSVLHDATARVQNQITRQEENSVVNDGFFLTAFCGNGIIHSFESVVMVKVFKKH